MKSREQLTCTNCKDSLNDKKQVFQGVIICDNCYKMVSHTIKKTQGELRMLFLVYTDLIRVGLLKGEFRPPVMPEGKSMPGSETAKALRALWAKGGKRENSNSEMSEVPGD